MTPLPLVTLDRVDVFWFGAFLLRDITWTLRRGENWLISGANGAGKSTLLRLILGDLWPHHTSIGKRLFHFDGEPSESTIGIRNRIGYVSAEQQDHYQRTGVELTGEQVILSGLYDVVWPQGGPAEEDLARVREVATRLRLEKLLPHGILRMSSGERRKLLIARALVKNPSLLLLDEALNNLDLESRREVIDLLAQIAADGTNLVYTTHRAHDVISGTTHRLVLEDGRIVSDGRFTSPSVPAERRWDNPSPVPVETKRRLIAIRNVDVYLNRVRVLRELNWEIWTHENWALIGRNGSGKSTLMRLVAGDHYPAWGGGIERFAFEVTGNVWELKEKIGFLSGELQTSHPGDVAVCDVVLSGFFGTQDVYTEPDSDQLARTEELIEEFKLSALSDRPFGTLSYGEKRRTLLARAMIHRPLLMILDEPCNGLDAKARSQMLDRIESASRGYGRILYATHHAEELPSTITHVALIEEGKLIFAGPRGELPEAIAEHFGLGGSVAKDEG